jgi:signal transduction histidine kinase
MKRKVILYFMIIILLTLSLMLIGFGIGIRQYYYQAIANTFQSQAEALTPILTKQANFTNAHLVDFSDEIIKNYQFKDAELNLLNRDGKLIQSSTGFYEDKSYPVNLSVLAMKTIYQIYMSEYSGEKVMAVYTPFVLEGQVVGVLRYATSLTKVNALINNLFGYVIIICMLVAAIVFVVSLRLGNSIVKPLNDIIKFTQRMPEGQYRERITKVYPHELGALSKMLNNMGDEILKTNRLKNDFISSISHELRTPLTGIKGWVETMLAPDGLSKEEFQFGLEIINGESERLMNLVENLLDFSRYQADRINLIPASVKVDKLIREVTFQLQKKAERKEIRLIVETTPVIITADGDKLKQVVLNMLDNAIKFSYKGGTINVTQTINETYVSIEISDTGIGIKEENLKRIMEPFYKIDAKSGGAGLGLIISRNIVEMHGGTLEIHSEYGKGTSALLKCPLRWKR